MGSSRDGDSPVAGPAAHLSSDATDLQIKHSRACNRI
jgi:hypothetical protein